MSGGRSVGQVPEGSAEALSAWTGGGGLPVPPPWSITSSQAMGGVQGGLAC